MTDDILNETDKRTVGLLITDMKELVNAIMVEILQEKPHKSYLEEKINSLHSDVIAFKGIINEEEIN